MYEINFIHTCVKIFYYCETNIIFFSNKSEKHLRSSMERGLHVIYVRSHVRWIILNIFPKKMYVFKLYIIHFRYRIYLILFIYKQLKRDIFPLIFVFFFMFPIWFQSIIETLYLIFIVSLSTKAENTWINTFDLRGQKLYDIPAKYWFSINREIILGKNGGKIQRNSK